MRRLLAAISACWLLLAACVTAFSAAADGVRVSEKGRRASSPEVAIGPDGAVNVIWLDKGLTADRPAASGARRGRHSHRSSTDLYFARSEDGGASWSRPRRVNDVDGEIWGFSVSKPRIGVGPTGTIHVFYPANDYSEAFDKSVVSARYRRSVDNGRTFSAPITINRPAAADREAVLGEHLAATNSFGTMGVAPDGTVIAAWQNTDDMQKHNDGADGYAAVSTDDGQSFGAPVEVLPNNDVCPCCQFTLTFDNKTAYLGLRKIFDHGRNSVVARSSDGGRSFSIDGVLDFEDWDIDGCPLKPTELGIAGDDVYAVAYTGGEDPPGLYFSYSRDGGQTFSGRQQVHPGASVADAPALTVDAAGGVRLVWHAKAGGPFRLYTSVSTDRGVTLSEPVALSIPAGKAKHPAAVAAKDGTIVVVWEHDNEEVFVTTLAPPAGFQDQ